MRQRLVVAAEQVERVANVVAQRPLPFFRLSLVRLLHIGQGLQVPRQLIGSRDVDERHHVQRIDRQIVEA